MAIRTVARALHTSSRALAAAAPVRAPRGAADLGFSGEKRERVLPSLDIPKASRDAVDLRGARGPREPRQQREPREQREPRQGDRQQGDRPRQARPPREQGDRPRPPREQGDRPRQPREQGDRPRQPREQGDRPRQPREQGDRPRQAKKPETNTTEAAVTESAESAQPVRAARKMDSLEVPAEFFEGADLAPAVPTASSSRSRERQTRTQGQTQTRERRPRDGQNRDGKPRGDRDGKPRGDRGDRRPREARAAPATVYSSATPLVQITRDVSPRGLFGAASILSPRPTAAADPASSFWAKDMDRAATYKTETLRRLGAYDIFVPPQPKETKDPKAAVIGRAQWVMGMNPSFSMRASAKGVDALRKLL